MAEQTENEYLASLREAIGFGLDAERFKYETIGQMVWRTAKAEADMAILELKCVDPDDAKAIREIQFRIKVAEAIPAWLEGVILQGRTARQLFLHQDQDTEQ